MAFRDINVTIDNTWPLIFEAQPGDLEVWLTTASAGQAYLLSGDNTGPGFRVNAPFTSRVRPGDKLYGQVSSGTLSVHVLVRSA